MSTYFMWAALITLGIAAPVILLIYSAMGSRTAMGACLGSVIGIAMVGFIVDHDGDLLIEARRAWEKENQLVIAECVQRTAARWSDCAQSEWVLRGGQ